MNWPDVPATEHQLALLRGLGFLESRPLTLTEAARLIRQYKNPSGAASKAAAGQLPPSRAVEVTSLELIPIDRGSGPPLPAGARVPNGGSAFSAGPSSPGGRAQDGRPPPGSSPVRAADISESTRMQAYRLRVALENAKKAMTQNPGAPNVRADLTAATASRHEFWLDTCRDVKEMRIRSVQVLELYQAYGCRFSAPIAAQVQDILDALDPAMPLWDRDHPELFYQTLELNFSQLLRLR